MKTAITNDSLLNLVCKSQIVNRPTIELTVEQDFQASFFKSKLKSESEKVKKIALIGGESGCTVYISIKFSILTINRFLKLGLSLRISFLIILILF